MMKKVRFHVITKLSMVIDGHGVLGKGDVIFNCWDQEWFRQKKRLGNHPANRNGVDVMCISPTNASFTLLIRFS